MADRVMETANKMNQKHKTALFLLLCEKKITSIKRTHSKSRVISRLFFAIINPILMFKNKTIADVIGNGKWKCDVFQARNVSHYIFLNVLLVVVENRRFAKNINILYRYHEKGFVAALHLRLANVQTFTYKLPIPLDVQKKT